jgi:serine-type D-Ala-D-Ala carboxypeptidase (penicillin-binding protein 5/6)
MLSTILSLYALTALTNPDLPATEPHIIPWNENILLETTAIPQKKAENIAPVIDAEAALIVDMKNGMILYEKNIHKELPIASLTKLMTAIIVIEENNPKEVVTISKQASKTEGSRIWLATGEKITVENLLLASLIHSANDAAMALAEYNSENVENFVNKMNKRTKELGIYSTHFINPTGLDNNNYLESDKINTPKTNINSNVSTAYDMAILGRFAYGKSMIRSAASKKEYEVASTNEGLKHKLKNTNDLLNSYLNVLGLKTGTTDNAGECLIAIVQNEHGNDILTVVLNSPARYKETKLLVDWAFRTYKW